MIQPDHLWQKLLGIGVIGYFFLLIYTKVSHKTFTDILKSIKEAFGGK